LEAKEKVRVQQESRTLASITFQNYFRMYQKLAGMTGTAITSAEEFHKVYGLEVMAMPTNKPMIRKDLPDSVYKTEKGKFEAIAREIKKRHEMGQPVLVGTVSIEKNELLSAYLKKAGIPHQVLNAKNHEQEAKIISQAGKKGTVTVATNMAGRGVDIILGGRPDEEKGEQKHDEVVKLGGLHVIGTERHEARRIDDQLRGRAGRQGDPGSSQFFVSLEDDLMRIFGGDRVKSMMEMLKVPEDQPIENKLVSKAIESAQAKIEGFNFDLRKHVLEYDDVMNKQRETIYKKRKEALTKKNIKSEILEMIRDEIKKIVQFHTQGQPEDWNYREIAEIAKSIFPVPDGRLVLQNDVPLRSKGRHFQDEPLEKTLENLKDPAKISDYLIELAQETYQKKEQELEAKNMRQIEKFVLLRSIDTLWMEHIDNMDHLRDSVRLRAYGQKDPLVEYKNEGIRMFKRLLEAIQTTVVNTIYKVALAPASQQDIMASSRRHSEQSEESHGKHKLGRNDPCPCGKTDSNTGKSIKYKKCCYPKYGR
jgi:preprotein translocase subunit SecA